MNDDSQVPYSYLRSTIMKFIEIINEGDSKRLIEMQTDDFTLIDMDGEICVGKDGWSDYFSVYPNYRIHVKNVLIGGSSIAVIGSTTDSHISAELEKRETVLWVAEIKDGLVARWQIYSDIDLVKASLGK